MAGISGGRVSTGTSAPVRRSSRLFARPSRPRPRSRRSLSERVQDRSPVTVRVVAAGSRRGSPGRPQFASVPAQRQRAAGRRSAPSASPSVAARPLVAGQHHGGHRDNMHALAELPGAIAPRQVTVVRIPAPRRPVEDGLLPGAAAERPASRGRRRRTWPAGVRRSSVSSDPCRARLVRLGVVDRRTRTAGRRRPAPGRSQRPQVQVYDVGRRWPAPRVRPSAGCRRRSRHSCGHRRRRRPSTAGSQASPAPTSSACAAAPRRRPRHRGRTTPVGACPSASAAGVPGRGRPPRWRRAACSSPAAAG